jgi:tetratricopeptide (TPR) repeat protein
MADTSEIWRKVGEMEHALSLAQVRDDPQMKANILILLGGYYCKLLQWADARASYEQAVFLLRGLPPTEYLSNALFGLGLVLAGEQRFSEVLPVLGEALQLAREGQKEDIEIGCLSELGRAATEAGEPERALSYLQEVLALVRRRGNRKMEVRELGKLGIALARLKREQEAMDCHEQALAIAREIGDQAGVAMELGNLGYMLTDHLRHPESAIGYFQQALAIFRQLEDRWSEAKTLMNIAATYLRMGQAEEALQQLRQARAIATTLGDRDLLGGIAGKEGEAYELLYDPEQAIMAHQRALLLSKGIGERQSEIESMSHMGFAWRTKGQPADALDLHQRALEMAREQHDTVEEGQQLGNIASDLHALGRDQEGMYHNQQALALFREQGNLYGEGRTLVNIGTAHVVVAHTPGAYEYRDGKSIIKGLAYWRLGQALLEIDLPDEAQLVQQKIDGIRARKDEQSFQRQLRASEPHFRWLYFQRLWPASGEALLRRERQDTRWYRSTDQVETLAVLLDEQPLDTLLEVRCLLSPTEWRELKASHTRSIARAADLQDRTLQGRLLYALGFFCASLGEGQEAIRNLQQALAIFDEIRDYQHVIRVAQLLGTAFLEMGQPLEAVEALQQGAFLTLPPHDHRTECMVLLRSLCSIYRMLGESKLARSLLQLGLEMRSPLDDPVEEKRVLVDLSFTCLDLGYHQKALEYLGQARDVSTEQMRNPFEEGALLCHIATAQAVHGKFTIARTNFVQAQNLLYQRDDLVNAGLMSNYIALTYLFQQEIAICLAHLRQGIDVTGESEHTNKRAKQLLQQIKFSMRRDVGAFQSLWEESSPHYAALWGS